MVRKWSAWFATQASLARPSCPRAQKTLDTSTPTNSILLVRVSKNPPTHLTGGVTIILDIPTEISAGMWSGGQCCGTSAMLPPEAGRVVDDLPIVDRCHPTGKNQHFQLVPSIRKQLLCGGWRSQPVGLGIRKDQAGCFLGDLTDYSCSTIWSDDLLTMVDLIVVLS